MTQRRGAICAALDLKDDSKAFFKWKNNIGFKSRAKRLTPVSNAPSARLSTPKKRKSRKQHERFVCGFFALQGLEARRLTSHNVNFVQLDRRLEACRFVSQGNKSEGAKRATFTGLYGLDFVDAGAQPARAAPRWFLQAHHHHAQPDDVKETRRLLGARRPGKQAITGEKMPVIENETRFVTLFLVFGFIKPSA